MAPSCPERRVSLHADLQVAGKARASRMVVKAGLPALPLLLRADGLPEVIRTVMQEVFEAEIERP